MNLFLCLSSISRGQYCRKSPAKSEGFRKNIKRRGGADHIGGGGGGRGVYKMEGFQTFCTLCIYITYCKRMTPSRLQV